MTTTNAQPPLLRQFLAACIAFAGVSLVIALAFHIQRANNAALIEAQEAEIGANASYIEVLETELETKMEQIESLPPPKRK